MDYGYNGCNKRCVEEMNRVRDRVRKIEMYKHRQRDTYRQKMSREYWGFARNRGNYQDKSTECIEGTIILCGKNKARTGGIQRWK